MSEQRRNFGRFDISVFDKVRPPNRALMRREPPSPPPDLPVAAPAEAPVAVQHVIEPVIKPAESAVSKPQAAETAAPPLASAEAQREVQPVAKPLETPPPVEQVVQDAVEAEVPEVFEEKLKAANLTEEERRRFEAIINNKNILDKISEFAAKKLKDKKIFGLGMDAVASFGGRFAFRLAVRKSLDSAISLSGWQLGAIVGATTGGVREWFRARGEQYSATSWLRELEGKDNVELAKAYGAVQEAIKAGRVKGDEEEVRYFILKLRDVETKIKAGGRDLSQVLEARGKSLTDSDLTVERQQLFRDMVNSRRWQVAKKVVRGGLMGAAIGAAGGWAGEWVGAKLSAYLGLEVSGARPSLGLKEKATEAIADLQEAKKEAIIQTLEKSAQEMPEKVFIAHVDAGEGLTHAGRDFLHDYIVANNGVAPGEEIVLNREQLIFAEDLLRRQLEGSPYSGQLFELKGQAIQAAIEKAQGLSSEEIANLKANWVGKISEATWREIEDYSKPILMENNFAENAHQEILAREVALDQAREIGAVESLPSPRPAAQEQSLNYVWYGLAGVGAAAAGVRYREEIGRAAAKASGKIIEVARDTLASVREQIARMGSSRPDALAGNEPTETKLPPPRQEPFSWESLRKSYGVQVSGGGGSPDQESKRAEVLSQTFAATDPKKLRGVEFKLGDKNAVDARGTVMLNPQTSVSELVDFLSSPGGLDEVERLRKVELKAAALQKQLAQRGLDVRRHMRGDAYLKALETLATATSDMEFPAGMKLRFISDAGPEFNDEYLNLSPDLGSVAMKEKIEIHLAKTKEG